MAGLPTSSDEITSGWLNDVLDDDVRGGAKVTAVETELIGEGVGFLGEVTRLTLTYDEPAPTSVTSMISKVPTANEGFRAMGLMLGLYQKEYGFYQDVAPQIDVPIPACYVNRAEGEANFLLLLEDLAPMRAGNQLASCTKAEAELVLAAAAQLHARWWEDPALDELAWLPAPGDAYFELLEGAYHGALDKFHSDFGHLAGPEIEQLADQAASNYKGMVDKGVGKRPHTLIHGDFRLDNMMFGDGPGQPPFALLDWQMPFKANPLWDVVYFLGGNFSQEWREENQEELLAGYHRALLAGGVENYSFEQCWQDYRAAGLVFLGYLVTGANEIDLDTVNDRGREVLELMLTRYAKTISDLGSAEFID